MHSQCFKLFFDWNTRVICSFNSLSSIQFKSLIQQTVSPISCTFRVNNLVRSRLCIDISHQICKIYIFLFVDAADFQRDDSSRLDCCGPITRSQSDSLCAHASRHIQLVTLCSDGRYRLQSVNTFPVKHLRAFTTNDFKSTNKKKLACLISYTVVMTLQISQNVKK